MHALAARRQLLVYSAAAALAVAVGAAVGTGGLLPYAFVSAVVGLTLLPLFARFGRWKLPIWLALSGVLYPFMNFPARHPVVTFDRVWIVGLAAVALTESRPTAPGARRSRTMWVALLALTFTFGARALLTSGGVLRGLNAWFDAIVLAIVLFAVCRRLARRPAVVPLVAASMAVGGSIVALIGIAERVAGFELASRTGGAPRFDRNIGVTRVSGPFSVPEVFALVLVICLAATMFWILLRRSPRAYALGGLAVALQCGGIAITYFRVAWLAAVVVLVGALALRPKRWMRQVGVLAVSLIFIYVGLVQLESSSSTVYNRLNNGATALARLAAYQQGLDLFASHPLFGVGIKRYTPEAEKRTPVLVGGYASVPEPHSSYILVLGEQGIVGFASLLWVTVAAFAMLRAFGRRATTRQDVLLSVCIKVAALAYLLFSLTLGMLPYAPSNWVFAVLLGLAAGRLDALAERVRPPATAAAWRPPPPRPRAPELVPARPT